MIAKIELMIHNIDITINNGLNPKLCAINPPINAPNAIVK